MTMAVLLPPSDGGGGAQLGERDSEGGPLGADKCREWFWGSSRPHLRCLTRD